MDQKEHFFRDRSVAVMVFSFLYLPILIARELRSEVKNSILLMILKVSILKFDNNNKNYNNKTISSPNAKNSVNTTLSNRQHKNLPIIESNLVKF